MQTLIGVRLSKLLALNNCLLKIVKVTMFQDIQVDLECWSDIL